MLIPLISLLCYPIYQAQFLFPSEAYHVMFGDISNMEEYFLPGPEVELPTAEEEAVNLTLKHLLKQEYTQDINSLIESFNVPLPVSKGLDKKRFDDANFEVYNFTRKRMLTEGYNYVQYLDRHDYYKSVNLEYTKMRKMGQIGLSYLIHTRFRLEGAFKQRESMRNDKRYKLGYLFCRLRRIKTEMLKLYRMGYAQTSVWWNNRMTVLMRVFEQMVRMDMDIRDTISQIKEIFAVDEPYDFMPTMIGSETQGTT